jgi:hypothetical protein
MEQGNGAYLSNELKQRINNSLNVAKNERKATTTLKQNKQC